MQARSVKGRLDIRFGRDANNRLVSAGENAQSLRHGARCLVCGSAMHWRQPPGEQGFFEHRSVPPCEHAALQSLRVAARRQLLSAGAVAVPQPPGRGSGSNRTEQRQSRMVIRWSAIREQQVIDGVTIDLFAATAGGPLIIELAIRGLFDGAQRAGIKSLAMPALEIAIADPTAIRTLDDLAKVVVDGTTNRHWLWHPGMAPPGRSTRTAAHTGKNEEKRSVLAWNPGIKLTPAALKRACSEVRLALPFEAFQDLLQVFDGGHPRSEVQFFAAGLATRIEAPLEVVIAMLRTAAVVEDAATVDARRQASLF